MAKRRRNTPRSANGRNRSLRVSTPNLEPNPAPPQAAQPEEITSTAGVETTQRHEDQGTSPPSIHEALMRAVEMHAAETPETAPEADAASNAGSFAAVSREAVEQEALAEGCAASVLFFQSDLDSVPPVAEEEPLLPEVERPTVDDLPPAVRERRTRLRQVVAGVVCCLGVFLVTAISKQVLTTKFSRSTSWITPAAAAAPLGPFERIARPQNKPSPAAEPPVPAMQPAEQSPSSQPQSEAAAAPPADPTPSKVDPSEASKLRKQAESLLNRGKVKDSIEVSRSAIEADPSEAFAYLLLGSALQTSGKWKDGVVAYCDCVKNATKGPINECRAMGGHK